MNTIQVFMYCNNEVRTLQQGEETWFVLRDVCQVLGLSNSRMVADRLDPDERGVSQIDTLGGPQETTIINESGLYHVILRSDKPEAKPFRKWVTSEVIPSIRKHGAYMTPETLQAAILNPDTLIQLCNQLKAEQDRSRALTAENSRLTVDRQIMAPKAEYFDELVERNTLTNFRETAKELHIPPRRFVQFLLELKYIYRDKKGKLLPMEAKNDGLFEVKECSNEKTRWSGVQTLVTPKGRETFRLLYV